MLVDELPRRLNVKIIMIVLLSLFLAAPAMSATLEWNRNTETDMKDYAVWACFTAGCVVTKSATTLQPGLVAQTAVGVNPTYTIDITGKEGSIAVSARDQSLNESALSSVQLPFNATPPLAPAGLRFR
jgi:hypothetical protein